MYNTVRKHVSSNCRTPSSPSPTPSSPAQQATVAHSTDRTVHTVHSLRPHRAPSQNPTRHAPASAHAIPQSITPRPLHRIPTRGAEETVRLRSHALRRVGDCCLPAHPRTEGRGQERLERTARADGTRVSRIDQHTTCPLTTVQYSTAQYYNYASSSRRATNPSARQAGTKHGT